MKKILLLSLLLVVVFSIGQAESVYIGITEMTATDSLTALDTVGSAARADNDTSNVFDVKKYEKLAFVFSSLHDTSFVNDTVGIIVQYSIDEDSLWVTLGDTLYKALASDSTYGASYYDLDTLPPMNYLRFILYHHDALEASTSNIGLFENTYDFTGKVWVKGWK